VVIDGPVMSVSSRDQMETIDSEPLQEEKSHSDHSIKPGPAPKVGHQRAVSWVRRPDSSQAIEKSLKQAKRSDVDGISRRRAASRPTDNQRHGDVRPVGREAIRNLDRKTCPRSGDDAGGRAGVAASGMRASIRRSRAIIKYLFGVSTLTDFDPAHPSNSVSVVVPAYNGAKFIAETLNSILGQTLRPAEVIVVNDGSTDNTAAIVEEFGNSVTLVNTQNFGECAARNTGVSLAKGNWIALCDGDDLWLPTKLEKQLRLANEDPSIHCVLTDYVEIADGVVANRSHLSYAPENFWTPEQHRYGFIVREPITGKLTTFQPGISSTSVVTREFYLTVGGFDVDETRWAADTCFHFRCLSVVPFGVVPEVLMHYRRHPESISADTTKHLRNSVIVWEHIIAKYPQAQPCRAELLNGLVAMRKEVAENERYLRRQRLKRMLGLK